jgi:hypothetical protein
LRSERGESVDHLLGLTENLEETARGKALLEILGRNPEEKKEKI